jgi:hypothetical protein
MGFTESTSVSVVYISSLILLLVSLLLLPFGKIQYSAIVCSVVVLILIITLTVVSEQERKTDRALNRIPFAQTIHSSTPTNNDADALNTSRNQRGPSGGSRINHATYPQQNYIHNYNHNLQPPPTVFAADVPGNIFGMPTENELPTCHTPDDLRYLPWRAHPGLCTDQNAEMRNRIPLPIQMESMDAGSPSLLPTCAQPQRTTDDSAQCGSGFTVVAPPRHSCGCHGTCTCGHTKMNGDQQYTSSGHKIVPNLPPFPGVAQYTGDSVWRLPEWPADQPSREECIAAVVSDLPSCSQQTPKEIIRNQGLYGIKGNVSCDLLKRSAVADTGFLQPLGARNAFLAYNSYDQLHAKDQFMIADNKQVF